MNGPVAPYQITAGDPARLGVIPTETGVLVAVASTHATRIEFCLFDATGGVELARLALPFREGPVFHGHIAGIRPGDLYGLRAHGPWDQTLGLLFNPAKLLIDPYATGLDHAPCYHAAQRADRADGMPDPIDSAPFVPKAVVATAPEAALALPLYPLAASVLYELHVRGFTMRHPAIPADMRGRFAGLAHPAAIEHLRHIGVTSVELMPAMAAIEERHLAALGLPNYWGYNPVAFMAPDPRLAPGGWAEVRAATDALRAAGIETILDVVFNHTGEGDLAGPSLSLRGLDQPHYFRLHADGSPFNDTGCGNTLALDQPFMLRLAMDALRAWALWGGVQGFRFDLATTLARRASGFDPCAPFLQAVAQDPVLSRLKLIAEPWDIGPGGWQTGQFPPPFAEWNDRFRDQIRRFWRGDNGMLGDLATRLAGSADLFRDRNAAQSINFITAHDGFTLADLVSFEHKHNWANGEQNRDGTDDNISWNNGAEGPTEDPAIATARKRDQAAMLATLLLARGTPMLSQGAELGATQRGNNNAYAQDNEITWLDWDHADRELIELTARLTRIRAAQPWAWQGGELQGAGGIYPDVVWCGARGVALAEHEWRDPGADLLMMLRTRQGGADKARLCLIFHRGHGACAVSLPPARPGQAWQVALSTNDSPHLQDGHLTCPPRTVIVLTEQKSLHRGGTDDALLARVAAAAGIDADWWDVDGQRHVVRPDTQRALLEGLGFPAATQGDAEESLQRLANIARRSLPISFAARQNRVSALPVPLAGGEDRAPLVLSLTDEQGETRQLPIRADNGQVALRQTPDGVLCREWLIDLPSLPGGRYRLEHQETTCALTIAPERCYQPLDHRVVGLTAQIYALRRTARDNKIVGDQGIGDLTTLREAAEFAGRHGAALLGINPLHALFPHQRDRASPYHPSDRRFIDPILIDITADDPGLESAALRSLLEESAPRLNALSALPNIDHREVWRLKARLLRAADRGNPVFRAWAAAASPALREFALFSAINDEYPDRAWQNWPPGLRDRESAALRDFAASHQDAVDFHLYLQFLCDRGLARAAGTRMELGLLRDLAVGAAGDGAECWANPGLYVQTASIGAPPDPMAPQGQVWALPPPNPHVWRATGFASFIELVQANMRHAGALRIDHILGLKRLFWVPGGAAPSEGAYIAAPMENLFAELALESQRHKSMVIGEDLGTVPPGLREAMADHAMLRNRVLLLDYKQNGFPPCSSYPVLCATSVSSHDLPTLAGWQASADIEERAALGLFDAPTAQAEQRSRRAAIGALERFAGSLDPAAIHGRVAQTPSLIATAQIEDLAGEAVAVNLPGTDRERPNWRRKIGVPLDRIDAGILEKMAQERGRMRTDEIS